MNVVKDYPIKVFLPISVWDDKGIFQSVLHKRIAVHCWILDTLGYCPKEYFLSRYALQVMDYMVFRFKNEQDAVLFKLVWA